MPSCIVWQFLLFVGGFCYVDYSISRVSQTSAIELLAVMGWRHPIRRLKISHEVTLIIKANFMCDLFDAQVTGFQQVSCSFHPKRPQIVDWGHTYVGSKNVTKPPDRKIHRLREFIKRQFLVQVVSHHPQYVLYSLVHTKAPVKATCVSWQKVLART